MSTKMFEIIIWIVVIVIIISFVAFGEIVSTDPSGEIVYQSVYVRDIIIDCFKGLF